MEQYSKDFDYGIMNAHNLNINEETGFAYIVGSNLCRGGLYIVNLNIAGRPYYDGCFSGDGYTHDVQCTYRRNVKKFPAFLRIPVLLTHFHYIATGVLYKGNDVQYVGREICFA